jgi:AcrR family transcriptional regulator
MTSRGAVVATGKQARMQRMTRVEARERTRTQLLDAAEVLVAERGVASASLDEIASAAGHTKGAIYANFASKDDLLLALIDRHIHSPERNIDLSSYLTDESLSEAERYARLSEAYAKLVHSDRGRRWVMFLLELSLYSLRNSAMRQRIADLLHTVRSERPAPRPAHPALTGVDSAHTAALDIAMDLGLALQALLDPARVPAELYGVAHRLFRSPSEPIGAV